MLSAVENKRNEALLLFLHPSDAVKVIQAGIQSIGGSLLLFNHQAFM
jgi:hypothetical protein